MESPTVDIPARGLSVTLKNVKAVILSGQT